MNVVLRLHNVDFWIDKLVTKNTVISFGNNTPRQKSRHLNVSCYRRIWYWHRVFSTVLMDQNTVDIYTSELYVNCKSMIIRAPEQFLIPFWSSCDYGLLSCANFHIRYLRYWYFMALEWSEDWSCWCYIFPRPLDVVSYV